MDVIIGALKRSVPHIPHEIWKHRLDVFAFLRPVHDVGTGEVMPEVIGSRLDLPVPFQPGRNPYVAKV